MAERKNVTDNEQEDLEAATFEGGIPVRRDGTIVTIVKGRGAAQRSDGSGVILGHDDNPGTLTSDEQGRAGPATPLVIVQNNSGIAFAQIIGNNTVSSATGTEFSVLKIGDTITVSGSNLNDGILTVSAIELAGARIVVDEIITVEIAGASITIIKN